MASPLLSEQLKVIGLGTTVDFNNGYTADSINCAGLHRVMFILTYGAVTGATPAALTVKSGASAGVQTTAETFLARYGGAGQGSASSDVYTDWTSQSTLSVPSATITTRTQIVEIECSAMTAGQPWLTLALDGSADSGLLGAVAVCVPRYEGNAIPTAV